MSGMTSYLQKKLLDDLTGVASYSTPGTLYLSLHTAAPNDTGSHAAEVSTSGTGYARQSLASKIGAADATSGIAQNTSTITFGPASASWGTISHLGIEDASSAGNMLLWAAPSAAKNIASGQSFPFVASQISLRFD